MQKKSNELNTVEVYYFRENTKLRFSYSFNYF